MFFLVKQTKDFYTLLVHRNEADLVSHLRWFVWDFWFVIFIRSHVLKGKGNVCVRLVDPVQDWMILYTLTSFINYLAPDVFSHRHFPFRRPANAPQKQAWLCMWILCIRHAFPGIIKAVTERGCRANGYTKQKVKHCTPTFYIKNVFGC